MQLQTKKMKLLYWFSKSKTKGFGVIKLSVTIDGKESQITTNIKTKKSDWMGNLKRFKDENLNQKLRKMEVEVEKLLEYMTLLDVRVSAKSVTETYKKLKEQKLDVTSNNIIAINDPKKKKCKFIEMIDAYIESQKSKVEDSTLKTYQYKKKKLTDYLISINQIDILSDNFDSASLSNYVEYLENYKKKISEYKIIENNRNYIARNVIFIKSCFRYGLEKGITDNSGILFFSYKKENKQDLRHFEIDELQRLIALDFKNIPNIEHYNIDALEIARDLFVFMCFTGFHSIDRENLKDDNLIEVEGAYLISGKRKKTNIEFNVPVHPITLSIIKKYGGLSKLPKFKKDRLNVYLKYLERFIHTDIGLSTKIGRKTFAHLSLNEWMIDKDTLHEAMGLASSKHISAYGKITQFRIIKKFNFNN